MLNSWKDITVGQYMQLEGIKKNQEDRILLYFEIVAFLFNVDPRELTFNEYSVKIKEIAFMNEMPRLTKLSPEVELNGVKFKRTLDIDEITGGQLIDFSVVKHRNNLAELLAVLYINPEQNFNQRVKLIKEYETMDSAYPYISFFLNYLNELLTGIQKYLNPQVMTMEKTSLHRHKEVVT